MIEDELRKTLIDLNNEIKEVRDRRKYAYVLAKAYYNIMAIHPFREGNGRTIREFIRQLAYVNGYIFNLQNINPQYMLNASIKSVINTDDLEKIIFQCLEKR